MVPAESEGGFRVTDRRRRAEDDAAPSPVSEPSLPRPEASRSETRSAPLRDAPRETPVSPGTEESIIGEPPPGGERSLAGLFVMLAGSAAMALGEAPDPMTGQAHRDLDQAADLIDLLILLREKTEGNRSPEETQILDEIVYDLQLRYVSATKRAGRPPGPARA
jgi:hypothetical protein